MLIRYPNRMAQRPPKVGSISRSEARKAAKAVKEKAQTEKFQSELISLELIRTVVVCAVLVVQVAIALHLFGVI